jgi:hypothetical protein
MVDQLLLDRRRTEDKLASTRQQLIDLLRHEAEVEVAEEHAFPRSRTMRLLIGGGGLKGLAVIGAGLLVSRPALVWRLLRLVPLRALTRSLLTAVASRASTPRRSPG